MTVKAEVIYHFDVWGNAVDGYQVNDSRRAGTIEIEGEVTREKVWAALAELGEVHPNHMDQAEWEEHGSGYYISDASNGRPLWNVEGLW